MEIYACILAEVETGHTLEAAEHLLSLDSVGLVVPTAGPYDLMFLVKTDNPRVLGELVIKEYQKAPGIKSTLTLLVLDDLRPTNWMQHLDIWKR